MPAAEEPKAGVCAEVLARSYPSLPFGLVKRAIWPLPSDQLPDFRSGSILLQKSAVTDDVIRPFRLGRRVLPAAGHRRMPILVAISAAGNTVLVVTAHNEAAFLRSCRGRRLDISGALASNRRVDQRARPN